MTKVLAVTIAVEGPSDASVVSRIVNDHGLQVHAVHGLHGVNHLNAKLEAFNQAAKFGPWLVVRDLDHEAECAAAVVSARLPKPSGGMRFRIAHRAIEAWLLADFEGIAAFFKVAREAVPHDPEALPKDRAHVRRAQQTSRRTPFCSRYLRIDGGQA